MITCDWWGAISLIVYSGAATLVGCWAVDRFTGVKAALERSKKWESKGSLSTLRKEEEDDEISGGTP